MARRVLSTDGGAKVEVSFQTTGKLLGIETRGTVTYWASVRPDGSLYGEAQGLVAGTGGERATFKAQGVGKLLDGGAGSYRGAQYSTATPEAQPLELGRHRLRVRGGRRGEHEEQAVGVEVDAGAGACGGGARRAIPADARRRPVVCAS